MEPLSLLRTALTQFSLATVLLSSSFLAPSPSQAEESQIGNAAKKNEPQTDKQQLADWQKLNANEQGEVLLQTIKEGQFETVKLLLAAGANVNYRAPCEDSYCTVYTPLFAAIEKNDLRIVKLLLEQGADPNDGWFDNGPEGAVNLAIEKNQLEIVKLLVNYKGKLRPVSFSIAAANGNLELIEFMISKGMKPFPNKQDSVEAQNLNNYKFDSMGWYKETADGSSHGWHYVNPLSSAILSGQKPAFDLLLPLLNKDPNRQAILNWSLFLVAEGGELGEQKKAVELVEKLIQAGAKIDDYQIRYTEDKEDAGRDMNSFHAAIYNKNLSLVSTFLKFKPNLELKATIYNFGPNESVNLIKSPIELAEYSIRQINSEIKELKTSIEKNKDNKGTDEKDYWNSLVYLNSLKENLAYYKKALLRAKKIKILLTNYRQ